MKNNLLVDYNSVVNENLSMPIMYSRECIRMNFIDGAISIPFA